MSIDDPQESVRNYELCEEVEHLREVLTLPLIFHGARFNTSDRDTWESITGTREATTKVMCDTIRAALAEGE